MNFATWIKASRIIPCLQDQIDDLDRTIQHLKDNPHPRPESEDYYFMPKSSVEKIKIYERNRSDVVATMTLFGKDPEREHLLTDDYMKKIGLLKN